MTQVEAWGLQIQWLIGLLFALFLLALLLTVLSTGFRVWLVRLLRRRDAKRTQRLKTDSRGRPLPPVSGGICERCEGVFDEVYHLPSGRRLCRGCFNEDMDV